MAITGAAHAVEALYGEVKYRIPPSSKRDRHSVIGDAFQAAFGLENRASSSLRRELKWLFERRGYAVHPYTEPELAQPHPAGINTAVEFCLFNAVESCRAIDAMMTVLGYAAAPPAPHSRWIERWVEARQPYHENRIAPLRESRAGHPLPTP